MAYAYVIELKYIKRSETLSEALMADTTRAAKEQLRCYLADQALRRRHPSVQHVAAWPSCSTVGRWWPARRPRATLGLETWSKEVAEAYSYLEHEAVREALQRAELLG